MIHEYKKSGDRHVVSSQLALPVDVEDDGEIRLYKIALPYLPPSKNVYDGWPVMWKHSLKKKWEKDILAKCDEMVIPRGVEKVGLAATLVFPSRARRDPQNYAQAIWHFVPDALQKAGVIDDDREGKIEIPGNWGVKFAYDLRTGVPKKRRERTILAMTMLIRDGQ